MPKARTGTVRYDDKGGCYWVRLTLNDGGRPWVPLSPATRSPNAEMRAREVAIEKSEIARKENLRSEDFGLKPRGPRGAPVAAPPGASMQDWVDAWTKLRTGRGLSTAAESESVWRRHIKPTIDKHVRDWSRDDFRRLSRTLDETVQAGRLCWKTARNVWVTATKMVADASGSKHDHIHVRPDNPAVGVDGPDRGASKAKQFLYPSEFLKLMNAPDEKVPLAARRAVALAVYLYARDGELREMRWDGGDFDLAHGVVSITRAVSMQPAPKVPGKPAARKHVAVVKPTKSGHTRRFAIEPNLLPLLTVMKEEAGGKGLVLRIRGDHLARMLRKWLKAAGADRPELHKGTATSKQLRWHDLRATGATWLAVRGDEPLKIKQRCGHQTFGTTELYIREAEAVRDGFGEVFPPLPQALLGSVESSGESSEGGPDPSEEQLRGQDLNLRPSGYEPDELPGCSTARVSGNRTDAVPQAACSRIVNGAVARPANQARFAPERGRKKIHRYADSAPAPGPPESPSRRSRPACARPSARPGADVARPLSPIVHHVDRVAGRVPQLFIDGGLRRGDAGLEQEVELEHGPARVERVHGPDDVHVLHVAFARDHLALQHLQAGRGALDGREARHIPEHEHVVQDGDLDVHVRRAVGHVADDARHLEAARQDVLVVRVVDDLRAHRGERRVDQRLGVAVALGAPGWRPVPLERVAGQGDALRVRIGCRRGPGLRRRRRICVGSRTGIQPSEKEDASRQAEAKETCEACTPHRASVARDLSTGESA